MLSLQYNFRNSHISLTYCIKDSGMYTEYKPNFHFYDDFVFSHAMKLLGLMQTLRFFLFYRGQFIDVLCFGQN
jgi:hypothetical protein